MSPEKFINKRLYYSEWLNLNVSPFSFTCGAFNLSLCEKLKCLLFLSKLKKKQPPEQTKSAHKA